MSDGQNTLIISDLHHRISGVSASIRALLPSLVDRCNVSFVANKPHASIEAISLFQLLAKLAKLPKNDNPIWHVRRNHEMFWGILARAILNRRLKLVFTSAAIRRHSLWPRYLISKMDAVIATSKKAADLVPNVKAIVPHGIDLDVFLRGGNTTQPWNDFDLSIGIVGRVRPEKGTDIFSQAICELLPKHPNACAVIVGKTTKKYMSLLKSMKEAWHAAGVSHQVFVLDEVSLNDMPAIYQSLDIVCCPAIYEGFGLVPIEAMVSGTAIVASKTGAYPDMIQEGRSGLLVDCGDKVQFTNALELLLKDRNKVEEFKLQGKSTVSSRFSLQHEVEGIVSVYQKLWSSQ